MESLAFSPDNSCLAVAVGAPPDASHNGRKGRMTSVSFRLRFLMYWGPLESNEYLESIFPEMTL